MRVWGAALLAARCGAQIAQQDADPYPPEEVNLTLLAVLIGLVVLLLCFVIGAVVFVVQLIKGIKAEDAEVKEMETKLDEMKVARDEAQAAELDELAKQADEVRMAYYNCMLADTKFNKAHDPAFYAKLKDDGVIRIVGDTAYDGVADEERCLDKEIAALITGMCGPEDPGEPENPARKEFNTFFRGLTPAQRADLIARTDDTDPKKLTEEVRQATAAAEKQRRARQLADEQVELRQKLMVLDRVEMAALEKARLQDTRAAEARRYKEMSPRLALDSDGAHPTLAPADSDEPGPRFRNATLMEAILAPGSKEVAAAHTALPEAPSELRGDSAAAAKLRAEVAALQAGEQKRTVATEAATRAEETKRTLDRLRIEKRHRCADKELLRRERRWAEAQEAEGEKREEEEAAAEAAPAAAVPPFVTAPWEHASPTRSRAPPGASAFGGARPSLGALSGPYQSL
eukprot:TRINITY_DN11580_c0_g1_i1.p2 TRINITY_DN11580_c0_g1~~TRINITY_DN11580_c0_g1_i1.p2  ORF type:complete len:459 (+),score=195.93 TRINITY_DN11580_c0_g1_i1:151-1527(+)